MIFSYTADREDEITIKDGNIVDVITMETGQDGWWMVRYGIQEGMAPSNYLSLIPLALPPLPSDIKGNVSLFRH